MPSKFNFDSNIPVNCTCGGGPGAFSRGGQKGERSELDLFICVISRLRFNALTPAHDPGVSRVKNKPEDHALRPASIQFPDTDNAQKSN